MRLLLFPVFMLLAGQAPSPADATTSLLQYGAIGAFCVILLWAYWHKDRELSKANERYVTDVTKLTIVLAQATDAIRESKEKSR